MIERRLGIVEYKDIGMRRSMKVAYHPEGNEEMREKAIKTAFRYIMGKVKNYDTEFGRFKREITDDWIIVIEE